MTCNKPIAIALGALLASMAVGQTALAQDSSKPGGSMQNTSMMHAKMMSDDAKWAAIDTDKDGFISRSEHAAYASSMFTKMDANGDGKISKDEMLAGMRMMHGNQVKSEDMSKMWAAMDTDKDGFISASEHAAYMDAMFTRMDANGDGKLSKEEMQAGMKAMHPAK